MFAKFAPATFVLLYSRLTDVTTVFTFHYAGSNPELRPSASDPYLLPLPDDHLDILASRKNPHVSHRSSRTSAMVLKVVKFQSPQGSAPSGLGQIYSESGVVFYQLRLLTTDLALLECLYAMVPNDLKAELQPPNMMSRQGDVKTPARIVDDFIVPSGYVDREYEDSLQKPTAEGESDVESRTGPAVHLQDPFTIGFEWLENEIHDALTVASPTAAFDESLDAVQNEIEIKLASAVPAIETLYVKFDDLKKAACAHSISTGFAL